jgi:uncharacterized membrane protein
MGINEAFNQYLTRMIIGIVGFAFMCFVGYRNWMAGDTLVVVICFIGAGIMFAGTIKMGVCAYKARHKE